MASNVTIITSLYHMEAVQLLVSAAFPTAFVSFSDLSFLPPTVAVSSSAVSAAVGTTREEALLTQLGKRLNHHNPQQQEAFSTSFSSNNKSDGDIISHARRGPFTECCSPTAVEAWRRLYRRWPPQLVNGRQLWRYDENELMAPSSSSSLSMQRLPCWTPHAVVYIGGFEAPDLRRVVAPQLFNQVPPFSSDLAVDRTVGGDTFNYEKQKIPKYAARVLDKDLLLHEKGCVFHEPDLLEIAIPVSTTPMSNSKKKNYCKKNNNLSITRRVRTFLSFASCQTNISVLQLASDPVQRVALRPAFGFSLVALKYALPPPVVGATRILRQWNASWSATPLSTTFWLSAVGHAVEQCELGETADNVDKDCPVLVKDAMVLAVAAASLVNKSPESTYSNYFLPIERLEGERGVKELMDVAGRLPVSELREMRTE
ncbi:hypothetical protein LSM04_009203 [Trypanosoma melophagium]|uniref:uncharacterized protein n=1 Tax=Trypanosoma melophagium TaxID=715481 RepID=UPI00351A136F|nr:hypothetical protein LSM04_009203 [Trypanosoma melophagium]